MEFGSPNVHYDHFCRAFLHNMALHFIASEQSHYPRNIDCPRPQKAADYALFHSNHWTLIPIHEERAFFDGKSVVECSSAIPWPCLVTESCYQHVLWPDGTYQSHSSNILQLCRLRSGVRDSVF